MTNEQPEALCVLRGGKAEKPDQAAAETEAAGREAGNLIDRAWRRVVALPRLVHVIGVLAVVALLYPYSMPDMGNGVPAAIFERWPVFWITCVIVFFVVLVGGVWLIRAIPALLERRVFPKRMGPLELDTPEARQAAQELPESARRQDAAATDITRLMERLRETQQALDRSEAARHRVAGENEQLRQRLYATGDF
jgi:hypothetical protein